MRDPKQEQLEERRARRIGEFVEVAMTYVATGGVPGDAVRSIRVRMPTEEEPSVLLVVKARMEGADKIAFVGAFSLADAILAWRAKVAAGTMKWREDVPWSER